MITISYNNKNYKISKKMKVIDFMHDKLNLFDENIIACKAFNEVKSLDYLLDRDCKLSFLDTSTSDGNRIYVRGLTYILIKAFE